MASWPAFLLLCLAVELTPGPNMAYLAMLGASSGRRAGMAAVAGIATGLAVVGGVAALGMAELIINVPWLGRSLLLAGVAYLLWLAWDCWRDSTPEAALVWEGPLPARRFFGRGMLTNLLNPKAYVFYATMLPGFVSQTAPDGLLPQALLLTGISVAVATLVHAGIVWLAGTLEPFMASPLRQRRMRRAMALLLVGVAAWFVQANLPLLLK